MSAVGPRKTHSALNLAGFRALATAAGLFQLTRELQAAGVLRDEAVDRIREAMVRELIEDAPRPVVSKSYEDRLRDRLKALFSGDQGLSTNVVGPPDGQE